MKNLLILLSFSFLVVTSCKKNTNSKDENTNKIDNLETIKAEFIKISDAAVLKGDSFIYGVVLDDAAKELAIKVTPMKKSEYDMVPVVIKGIIKDNPVTEGWEKVVEIKQILKVLPVVPETTEAKNTIEINAPE